MVIRTGKALAQERAWRAQSTQRMQARPAPVPLRDDAGVWLGVCVVLAFVAALLLR